MVVGETCRRGHARPMCNAGGVRELTDEERALLARALEGALPARWDGWELTAACDRAQVDDDGEIQLPLTLAWFTDNGALLGAVHGQPTLLHLADLEEVPHRAQAYLRALMASLPRTASARGFEPGDPLTDLLPAFSLLEDMSLSTFEQFEAALARPAWLDDADEVASSEGNPVDLGGTEPIAVDPYQEAELAQWVPEHWPYIRYARWLKEHGDPRGELIAAQTAAFFPGARVSDMIKRRVHRRSADFLLLRHGRYFLGPFATQDEHQPFADEVFFAWERGFIRRIELRLGLDEWGPSPGSLLRAVLALPSSRLASTLSLAVAHAAFESESRHALPRWTEPLVASGGHAQLRQIVIASSPALHPSPYFHPVEGPPILTQEEDVTAIRAVFPRAELIAGSR